MRQWRIVRRVMPPGGAIECANSASVRERFRLIVGDRDQAVTGPARDIIDNRTGHSGVRLIVNHPVRSVETHQPGTGADPDSAAWVCFDVKDPGTGQGRVAGIIHREGAVVAGDELPQPVL